MQHSVDIEEWSRAESVETIGTNGANGTGRIYIFDKVQPLTHDWPRAISD